MPDKEREQEQALGTVWIDSSRAKVPLLEEAAKMAEAVSWIDRTCGGQTPPKGAQPPSSIVYCPEEEDVAEGVRRLQALVPEAPVVVFVPSIDPHLVRTAMRTGARGLVHAGMDPEQIARALSVVSDGEIAVPRELFEALLGSTKQEKAAKLSALKPRQREILELVSKGLTNRQVAKRLFLAESTVKQHLRAAYRILEVKSRYEATSLLRASAS